MIWDIVLLLTGVLIVTGLIAAILYMANIIRDLFSRLMP